MISDVLTLMTAMLVGSPTRADQGAEMATSHQQTAMLTLGGGCFWCLEAVYEDVPGVLEVTSGYAGGKVDKPSYSQVVTGRTGHAEVVQISYDPAQIELDKLLEIFWVIHDPTTVDRQGNDVGSQYRSIILYRDEAQQQAIRASIARGETAGTYEGAFTTEVVPLGRFWPAEDYHQDYFANNPDKPYCAFVVAPKVMKYRQHFGEAGR